MDKYTLVRHDGFEDYVEGKMTLHAMQEFVGGYIELHQNIFCNEDGIRLGLPRNQKYPHLLGNVIVWERRK